MVEDNLFYDARHFAKVWGGGWTRSGPTIRRRWVWRVRTERGAGPVPWRRGSRRRRGPNF